MNQGRVEIRDRFKNFLLETYPREAEQLLNATEFGLQVLLLAVHELSEGEDVYDITDLQRVEEWSDKTRVDPQWQRLLGHDSTLEQTLTAYRRFIERLDLEEERPNLKPARPVKKHTDDTQEVEPGVYVTPSQHTILIERDNVTEGNAVEQTSTKYERSKRARQLCIDAYGGSYRCEVCGFDFAENYGPRNKGKYIEVHHIVEHAKRSKEQGTHAVNYHTEMIPLCANCHRMIHFLKGETIHPDELKKIWNERHGC